MKESEQLKTEAEWILKHMWQTAVSLWAPTKAASDLQLQCDTGTGGTEGSSRKHSSNRWSVFSVGNSPRLIIFVIPTAKPIETSGNQSHRHLQATAGSSTLLYNGNKMDFLSLQMSICRLIV